MKLEKCKNGHIYNKEIYIEKCPYCLDDDTINKNSISSAITLDSGNKTMAYWLKESSVNPVVGWLVCIHGANKGKDYKIHSERNFIGRGEDMHISIDNDLNIARNKHCSITYNPKQKNFVISPGEGSGIVYLQGKAIYDSKPLYNFDVLEIGDSRFIFVAFCGENFDWNI